MSEYGFATWDTSGKPNNYGIKPVTVVGIIDLAWVKKLEATSSTSSPV